MSVTKTPKEVEAFVADLRKTKGGVVVEEANGETVVRTRDGDVHRFQAPKPKAKAD
jgi:hypothetical protein